MNLFTREKLIRSIKRQLNREGYKIEVDFGPHQDIKPGTKPMKEFCTKHEFDPADLSRFLAGKKDWQLEKVIRLMNCLDLSIFIWDYKQSYTMYHNMESKQ